MRHVRLPGGKTPDRLYRAFDEAVNEFQAGNSPPETGGVAAPSRKRCEATAAAQTGWLGLTKCFRMRSSEVSFSTIPSAPLKEASRLLLDVASTPPLPGGEWHAQFIHAFFAPCRHYLDRLLG